MASHQGYLRIGELARRTGVSPELLRAWERRYGLLRPDRSPGGFRLYGADDERRVRAMQANLAHGLSAAEAARLALAEASPDAASPAEGSGLAAASARLRTALYAFDEAGAQAALDELLAGFSIDALLAEVVMPTLSELGARWASGEATIAQEHFASNVLRGRLLALARDWGRGLGPVAILAAPPREQHDLALVCFGLALRARGWRITYLGPDTPVQTIRDAARALAPSIVVVAAEIEEHLERAAGELEALGREVRLAVAGAGASVALAERANALLLSDDPVSAAERVNGLAAAA
jgi:DNA-binding transcriptional MerR regulator